MNVNAFILEHLNYIMKLNSSMNNESLNDGSSKVKCSFVQARLNYIN